MLVRFETSTHSCTLPLSIPLGTLEQLKEVAASKDLGCQSLLKLYNGEGLRKDLSVMKTRTLLNETENLLRKHLGNDRKLNTILNKLRKATEA